MFAALALAALSLSQTQPGSIADQATRPLWIIGGDAASMAAIDRAPTETTPSDPVEATFWLFLDNQGGYDTMAAAMVIDCASQTFVHHSFAGYQGTSFIGATVAQDTSSQTAESDTYYGAMLAHVCDPSPDATRPPDLTDFRGAVALRGAPPA